MMLGLTLLRVAAWTAVLWCGLHPSDWSPIAIYLLRGVCLVCFAAKLAAVRTAAGKPNPGSETKEI
jgi:hypothetical protein